MKAFRVFHAFRSEKGKKRHNFSPKRQAWVSEFKKEVVRSPSDFDFITFFDRRFLSKLYEFLKTKIPDIEEESVKKWVQRHPWITHPVASYIKILYNTSRRNLITRSKNSAFATS